MSEPDRLIARTEVMARILRISMVHIGRLSKAGILPEPVSKGRWDVMDTVHAYLKHITGDVEETKGTIKSEELRLIAARREKTELEAAAQRMRNAELDGNLVRSVDVEREWSDILLKVKTKLEAMPARLAPRMVAITSKRRASDLMRKSVADVLTELADDNAEAT